jgi:biopolymer transport protein ExbB/TolQ
MRIIEWHVEGGLIYMLTLSTLLIINLILIGKFFYSSYARKDVQNSKQLLAIKFIGVFAISFGIFAQTISLTQIFEAIEAAGEVSQALLVGGLEISMYTTVYGLFIFLISYFCWFLLKQKVSN